MKVCLRLSTANAFYEDLVNFPPKGVKFKIPKMGSTRKDKPTIRWIKKKLWIEYTKFRPPSVYVDDSKDDLIYSLNGTMILNKKPWIVDAEHVGAFCNFHTDKLENKSYKNSIKKLLLSKHCKKILPWTMASKKTIEDFFNRDKRIREKLEVVYPTIKKPTFKPEKKAGKKVKLLFVGSLGKMTFYEKGGVSLLESFEVIRKKQDVELTIIANVPKEIKRKYRDVNFIAAKMSRNSLFKKIYSTHDILVLPSLYDTFGGVLLEGMSCGLPIVTTDIYAMPELGGLMVHTPISIFNKNFSIKYGPKTNKWKHFIKISKKPIPKLIDGLSETLNELIEDDGKRRKIGKENMKKVIKGKFSIEKRNKKLKTIFDDVISD